MYEWINLALLLFSLIMFATWHSLSNIPVTLSERRGERAAWKCRGYRFTAILFEFASIIFIFLWLWYPIEGIEWPIHQFWWVGVTIAGVIALAGGALMLIGIFHACRETYTPSKKTGLFGGIYNYIRHPQTLGEMLLFIASGFAVNSWFMVLLLTAFVIIYTPIILTLKEKELAKRFGMAYQDYRRKTGGLLPKIRRQK